MPILQSTGPMSASRPPRLPAVAAQFLAIDSIIQQIGVVLGLWSFVVNPASIVSSAALLPHSDSSAKPIYDSLAQCLLGLAH